ncbi:hypothetical protein BDR22DRAFT_823910 [Usnea florida]
MSMSRDPFLGDSHSERTTKICYEPSPDSIDVKSQNYLIYFIPGNPGIIDYYGPFLSKLHTLLPGFHICGHSLRGFQFVQNAKKSRNPSLPYGLDQQIEEQEKLLYDHIRSQRAHTGNSPKVILMGHSVGCYMLLELIQQHRHKIEEDLEEDFDLIGGILLFPTITHIAQSPLGMVFGLNIDSIQKILQIPNFAVIVGAIARFLSSLVPESLLHRLVKLVTRFPDYAAATTTSFIRSPMGVRQALQVYFSPDSTIGPDRICRHLAKDEMTTITDDRWDEEVWGAATSPGTNKRDTANSNLTFYWGQKDKWVADHTRDALIKARGHLSNSQTESVAGHRKPVMMVDKEGMPHDFCTTLCNSYSVASKVNDWVHDIVDSHSKQIS